MTLGGNLTAGWRRLGLLAFVAGAPALAGGPPTPPIIGATRWVGILCQFSDQTRPFPRPLGFFQDLLFNRGTRGLADYFSDMSYAQFDVSRSDLAGPFTTPQSYAQLADNAQTGRGYNQFMACYNAAVAGGVWFPQYTGVLVFLNLASGQLANPSVGRDAYAVEEGGVDLTFGGITGHVAAAVVGPSAWNPAIAAHEMGHGYGLEHSWSWNTANGTLTEYADTWDLMGNSGFLGSTQDWASEFLTYGPGLSAPQRDRMGWIPANRQYIYPGGTASVVLAPLTHPENNQGYLMARIPIRDILGNADPGHYYTVEFRVPDGWDQALGDNSVLIHEIVPQLNGIAGPEHQVSVLPINGDPGAPFSEHTGKRFEGSWLVLPGNNGFPVFISVQKINSRYPVAPALASVTISNFPFPAPPPAPQNCQLTTRCNSQVVATCSAINQAVELDRQFGDKTWDTVSTDTNAARFGAPQLSESFVPVNSAQYQVCSVNYAFRTCTDTLFIGSIDHSFCGGGGGGGLPPNNCGTSHSLPCPQ